MASKGLCLVLLIIFCSNVESASLLERSYEYVIGLSKSLAPNFMSFLNCFGEDDVVMCAKEKAGKLLDSWDAAVEKQRRKWREAADAEVLSSGRSLDEMPSKLGVEVESSLTSLAEMVQYGIARALEGKMREGEGIDTITISTTDDKKKIKKKKPKPPKIHLLHPVMVHTKKNEEKGRGFQGRIQSWVIGDSLRTLDPNSLSSEKTFDGEIHSTSLKPIDENSSEPISAIDSVDAVNSSVESSSKGSVSFRRGRGFLSEMWDIAEKGVDAVAEHAVQSDATENGIADKGSFQEQRGKKKKKKKAILKLLILGAVLKAKIGTILQILSFKLQVKFFILALIGLGINLARFWIDLKKKHDSPQKVIYYEHAQHQHHYEHEDESGWGPWSRSMDPENTDIELDVDVNSPYRAHNRQARSYRHV